MKTKSTKKKLLRAGVPGRASKRSPTAPTIRATRDAVRKAVARAMWCKGETMFTFGYRTAAMNRLDAAEDQRLYEKEMQQWKQTDEAEATVTAALAAYVKAVKRGD